MSGLSEIERERLVEEIAERISWDGGDFTRWSADAVEDHNRWSWRGDGHGPAMRAMYRQQARAAVDILAARLEAVTALLEPNPGRSVEPGVDWLVPASRLRAALLEAQR